jgi:hypothetical protein
MSMIVGERESSKIIEFMLSDRGYAVISKKSDVRLGHKNWIFQNEQALRNG